MKDFQYIVVVNRSTDGFDRQTIQILKNGQPVKVDEVVSYLNDLQQKQLARIYELQSKSKRTSDEKDEIKYLEQKTAERPGRIAEVQTKIRSSEKFLVSTGRHGYEAKGEHHSRKDSWSVTPTGYYVPQYFSEKHKSESYSSSLCDSLLGRLASALARKQLCTYMENAIFFNRAIALHKAIPGTEDALGEKASGGCVRLPAALAEYLYWNLKTATDNRGVPVVSPDGKPELNANGNVKYSVQSTSIWGTINAISALIIVTDQVKR